MSGAPGLGGELQRAIIAFLNFCRLEKGLAANSISAYSADLQRFSEFAKGPAFPDAEGVRHYLDSLYQAGLSNRSIGRHVTTLRNFYAFLLREGLADTDPTEHLRTPRQWQTIPKFLNLEQIEQIVRAPDLAKPTGLRDRAMME